MHRAVVAALLACALSLAGCVTQRTKRAEAAMARGDRERAYRIWNSIGKRGNSEALYQAGLMQSTGQGVKRDAERGASLLLAAARQGHPLAAQQLGQLYVTRSADATGDPDAERWLLAAAEHGPVTARYGLAVLYLKGEIVEQNPEEALRWFRRCAKGWKGLPIRLNKEGILREVAELGLAEAQHALGRKYFAGNGVPQSIAEAAKWQYLAANQGHLEAQLAIAWAYGMGKGIPKDIGESARWFRRAAEAGNPEAQYQLGMLLARGLGTPKDRVRAHMWFNLASAQGHRKAGLKRDTESRVLSAGQRAEAERLALQWFDEFARREKEAEEPEPPGVATAEAVQE